MKRLLSAFLSVAFVALAGVSVASAAEETRARVPRVSTPTPSSEWVGFAVSPNGRVFRSDFEGREAATRDDARGQCQNATLRTCAAISVPIPADVSVITCRNNGSINSFIAGSMQSQQYTIALDKAWNAGFPSHTCSEVWSY